MGLRAYSEVGTPLPRIIAYRPRDLQDQSKVHPNAGAAEDAVDKEIEQHIGYNPSQPWAEGIVEVIPEEVLTPQTLALIRSAGGYHTPSMIRFTNRLEYSRRLGVLCAIADGIIPGRVGDRLKAMAIMKSVGVPTQIEVRPFAGTWEDFTAEELERVAGGEHPQDVLEDRTRQGVTRTIPMESEIMGEDDDEEDE